MKLRFQLHLIFFQPIRRKLLITNQVVITPRSFVEPCGTAELDFDAVFGSLCEAAGCPSRSTLREITDSIREVSSVFSPSSSGYPWHVGEYLISRLVFLNQLRNMQT